MHDDLVTVGRIATAHGIRGELAVDPETDNPERFAPGSTLLLVAPRGAVTERRVLGSRPHQGRLLVLLEGVPDRTAAEALRGGRLCVREADLPELAPGSVWRHDLPGMSVVAEDGEELGTVRELLQSGGANAVLVVAGPRGEFLVPFIEQMVTGVDAKARRLTVRLPEGLLPD
jgi:16S rRNA processing protein RimM